MFLISIKRDKVEKSHNEQLKESAMKVEEELLLSKIENRF